MAAVVPGSSRREPLPDQASEPVAHTMRGAGQPAEMPAAHSVDNLFAWVIPVWWSQKAEWRGPGRPGHILAKCLPEPMVKMARRCNSCYESGLAAGFRLAAIVEAIACSFPTVKLAALTSQVAGTFCFALRAPKVDASWFRCRLPECITR